MSAPLSDDPAPWLAIEWAEPQTPSLIELIFDDDATNGSSRAHLVAVRAYADVDR